MNDATYTPSRSESFNAGRKDVEAAADLCHNQLHLLTHLLARHAVQDLLSGNAETEDAPPSPETSREIDPDG